MDRVSSDTSREVYAHFGLAYYFGECLHRELCNFYMVSSFSDRGSITRLRAEELLKEAWGMTLGQIVTRVSERLPSALASRLPEAVAKRNYLAHRFWYENIHRMMTEPGALSLIEELEAIGQDIRRLDHDIQVFAQPYHERIGFTSAAMQDAMAAVVAGEDQEPLWPQRLPKRREHLVKAYTAVLDQGSIPVFEADDRSLWTLGEVGLGWAPFLAIDPSWTEASEYQRHLPATVDARPASSKPWNYEIVLSKRAAIHVRPGSSDRKYKVTVTPPTPRG